MASKLQCPFCQQDLGIIISDLNDFICLECGMWGSEQLWRALIQSQRDLQIAKQALEDIEKRRISQVCNDGDWMDCALDMDVIACKALAQITHDNKE